MRRTLGLAENFESVDFAAIGFGTVRWPNKAYARKCSCAIVAVSTGLGCGREESFNSPVPNVLTLEKSARLSFLDVKSNGS